MEKLSRKHMIAILAVVLSGLFSSFGYYFYQVLFSPNLLVDQSSRSIKIDSEATFQEVLHLMTRERIVSDLVSFAFLARLWNYDDKVQAGYYKIESNMSNLQALHLLRNGRETGLKVSFHSLRLLEDLPSRIGDQLQLSADDTLLGYLCSDSVSRSYGFTAQSFALMFIPNTYELYWTTPVHDFLRRMHREHDRFWNEKRCKQANDLGLSPIEVGILASIVQAETSKEKEMPTIAGVYINRLRAGMPLGADPTLIFAWQDFSIKRVRHKHKKIASSYNTYRYKGLPPGPINLPEISSIDAVLAAEKHQYFYFCAKDDFGGYHLFSEDFETHQLYARRYQQALDLLVKDQP